MYESYFNLTRNPFELTPDPASFVPSRPHNEALAALYYGVRRHKGFVVVTGEVRTGKTLVLRCLLRLMRDSRDIAYAYVFNARLSPTEFLQYILADLGLAIAGKSKCELLLDLGKFLAARCEQRMTTVLIVDEAHHLSPDILEEVRLLSNLETASQKLLQIILAGQPELDLKLDSPGLRQLKQRIAVRAYLRPLSHAESREYIERRLHIAGANSTGLFLDDAVDAVFGYSMGLPRLINTLCDNALLTAYARNSRSVTAEMVDEIAREFRLGTHSRVLGQPAASSSSETAGEAVRNMFEELMDSDARRLAGWQSTEPATALGLGTDQI